MATSQPEDSVIIAENRIPNGEQAQSAVFQPRQTDPTTLPRVLEDNSAIAPSNQQPVLGAQQCHGPSNVELGTEASEVHEANQSHHVKQINDPTTELKPTTELYNTAVTVFRKKAPEFEKCPERKFDSEFRKLVGDAYAISVAGWPGVTKGEVYAALKSNNSPLEPQQTKNHSKNYRMPSEMLHDEKIGNLIIDFALSVWLMADCSRLAASGRPWSWPANMSIRDFVVGKEGWYLRASEGADGGGPHGKRFPPGFTAVKLEIRSGIEVEWTKHLSDHLLLSEQGHRVSIKIFRYTEWLQKAKERHEAKDGKQCPGRGLPITLLEETLRTLDLIFPLADERTRLWTEERGVPELLKYRQTVNGRVQTPKLGDFDFWRERLLDLVEIYQAPPRTPKAVWRDRRNPVSFWTFWIGLVIFFATLAFGLIASVLAGVTISDARSSNEAEAIASLAAAISHLSASP